MDEFIKSPFQSEGSYLKYFMYNLQVGIFQGF